ncbi:MAG: transcription termination/antitermination protein NusA [Dehalococcoidia bacterium]|jgi:N utilization substance protein A|nr:MAG: transcription termination/antitermination protein NusA [Dehalococcoidia bacterium]
MKSDFLLAITQLSAEKNLPKEVVIGAVEAALVSAYRKDNFAATQNISVKIDPNTGKVRVWAEKDVVEQPSDSRREISLDEARQVKPDVQIGDTIEVEATPRNAGRIAAQTAKQVILQRLHEAEHSAIFEEYAGKESDIVTGLVRRIEPRQIFIDLGRTEAILPAVEQVPTERYRMGQRLKVYLLEVTRTNKGPRVAVSRSHPNMLRRLFELEIPEVYNGAVELKSVAREAGYRSKVAVAASQEGIDPVGCCVGLRGIRIQNIVNELNGEKIDVVMWSPDISVFITNALSPAQVLSVELDGEQEAATVIVPDKQLSLAIGKEGQNVRLAAKLTGWRIDIKSASEAEAERVAEAKHVITGAEEVAIGGEELPTEEPTVVEPALASEEAPEETAEPVPALDTTFTPPVSIEPQVTAEKVQLRFAEDILVPTPIKPGARSRKRKKKGVQGKGSAEDGIKIKKRRRVSETLETDEEGEEY